MNFFSVVTLIGGLAFFLYGMEVMSGGLKKMAGGKLQASLERMTSNALKGLVLGAGITAAIQSSSAMTVMLVGLVNSGLLAFGRTVGVIMGSNIGTTVTAWILSLSSIEGDSFFLQLLKPANFSPVIAMVGVLLIMAAKRRSSQDIGKICVGFAVLMYGMELMSDAVTPLAQVEGFGQLFYIFSNPLLGVLVGAVFTGIIQSSSASVGILMALAGTGSITYGTAIPIIMGQNIGTCVTALISSIGVSKNAKRVAAVHVSFNIIGTAVLMSAYYAADAIFNFAVTDAPIDLVGVAAVHSIFNIITTAMLLPFSKGLERLARLIVRGDGNEGQILLDDRLLDTVPVAVDECGRLAGDMAVMAKQNIFTAAELCNSYDHKRAEGLLAEEQRLDNYEDVLGTFLVKLSSRSMTETDSRRVSTMLHTIGELERIGDHAVNVLNTAEQMYSRKVSFSPEAKAEMAVLTAAIYEITDIAVSAYTASDPQLAKQVEPLEQVIDSLIAEIGSRHISRLQHGECTIELGFMLSELLNNYERVSDHCSNLAVAIIEISRNEFDTHRYLERVRSGLSESFNASFEQYSKKYKLD